MRSRRGTPSRSGGSPPPILQNPAPGGSILIPLSSDLPVHRKPVPDRVCSARTTIPRLLFLTGTTAVPLSSISRARARRTTEPVSVLDSSFLGDETSPSPSSVAKRAIHFKADQLADWEETRWSQEILTVGSDPCGFPESDDPDFIYVADILRSSDPHRDPSDLCARREKRHQPTGSTCLHRRLVFDAVTEILDRKRHVSPWDAFTRSRSLASNGSVGKPLLRSVWAEFLRVRAPIPCDDLLDVTCGAFGRTWQKISGGPIHPLSCPTRCSRSNGRSLRILWQTP
uniref:DUF4378 domain-containing protein n=1 Tax=Ananas comosus var. bracteatus TaxID=296719 RepID=A0A6V7QRY3_ANACO